MECPAFHGTGLSSVLAAFAATTASNVTAAIASGHLPGYKAPTRAASVPSQVGLQSDIPANETAPVSPSAEVAAYTSTSASPAAFTSAIGPIVVLQNPVAYFVAHSPGWAGWAFASFTAHSSAQFVRAYRRACNGLTRSGAQYRVADALVSASTGTGRVWSRCLLGDAHVLSKIIGGGVPRSKVYMKSELEMLRTNDGKDPRLLHAQYELQDIIPVAWFRPGDKEEGDRDVIGVRLPLDMLVPKLDVENLKDLCEIHDIAVTSRHHRGEIEQLLLVHECDLEVCEDSLAVLTPYYGPDVKRKHDIQSVDFAVKQIKQFSVDAMKPFLSEREAASATIGFRIKQIGLDIDMPLDDTDILVRDLPLHLLVPRLTVAGLHTFASHHKIRLLTKMGKLQCADILQKHNCSSCRPLFYVVTPIGKTRRTARLREPPSWIDDGSSPFLWDQAVTLSTEEYPPHPTTMYDMAVAMRGYCSELEPRVIEESGCCVCGQLTSESNLVSFAPDKYDLSKLEQLGCSRVPRDSGETTIQYSGGPVLVDGLNKICIPCNDSLKNGVRPKMAVANHLWVGDVPDCLKGLTLAEMAMVTRIRYNRCVVRISSGHAKMTANVIAFEHPTVKIYERLPMRRTELEEVLAVLYTGMEPPGDDDLRRSPALVRRAKVKEALEWLKLNHRDYRDLEIDYHTLDTYPLENVPVGVFYKNMDAGEGNVPDAAKSVFDNTLEEGTEAGPCPFTVHGLTAERFTSMTTTQRKLAAVQQLKNGGKLLAVGHDTTPQTIWSNPRLYPQMFPWLFPYGHGGVDADEHVGKISREVHIKWLMMYHDKRFQRDANFLIVLFNHQLIRQSSGGSFMMAKRKDFKHIVDTVHQLDPVVLRNISDRVQNGGRATPQSPEEQRAFRVLDHIEYVGNRVSGSMARRKYLRSEVWSLIYFMNSPAWFVTISPADNKHPLCIHWAGSDEKFRPEIKGYAERKMIITRNPVACARFFHHLVQIFIKHICGWSEDGAKRGVFGTPAAFYGTVEQQGRMTLHLHFLLWLRGQMSLNEIREKLKNDDCFIKEISEYIDSCMVGGFSTGTKDEVEARVPRADDFEDRGIHSILRPEGADVPADYVNPTLVMPEPPPDEFCRDVELCGCENCEKCRGWYDRFKVTLDDILLRSNVHQCFDKDEVQDGAEATETVHPRGGDVDAVSATDNVKSKKKLFKAKGPKKRKGRRHATAKGCINKYGQCTARFPREVYMRTLVDRKTGHLNPRHTESSINDVAPVVTVANLCNTDARFLLSGTAVKATVAYVTDYITKGWLKTYQVFSSMYDAFSKHSKILDDRQKEAGPAAREMILKVVNSLSSKMEIGAPMAALYLLGNPDHYTSHQFVTFYWKNYVSYVDGEWHALDRIAEAVDDAGTSADLPQDVGLARQARSHGAVPDAEDGGDGNDSDHAPIGDLTRDLYGEDDLRDAQRTCGSGDAASETVQLTRQGNVYMAKAHTDDYRFRPAELEEVSLYEFIQCSIKHPIQSSRVPRQDLRFFHLLEDHPQSHSHVMACDPDRRYTMVPNFAGHALPRSDVGDREEYCKTMLTLFKPWRTGIDLKWAGETWEERFDRFSFTARARELMVNFNVRYECYDAKDDFAKILRATANDEEDEEDDSVYGEVDDVDGDSDEFEDDLSSGIGPATQGIQNAGGEMISALKKAGWCAWDSVAHTVRSKLELPKIVIDVTLNSGPWRNIVKAAKERAWRRKMSAMSGGGSQECEPGEGVVRNDAYVVPSTYLSKDFEPPERRWSDVMEGIIRDFTLNEEQEKAFRIVANHACEIAPDQLLMHLGGMAGTGKSTVIRALTAFFTARKEPYRFVLMGPTGTSAALIGGSTYHSFLGLNTGSGSRASVSMMEEVKERLTGVGYLLIDEQSMLNCRQLCAISARCCDALGVYERPFGGLNVILCGDFAQLPPVKGYSLYSREVTLRQSARQTIAEQENTIGKLIWLQFSTVVILKENMRQIGDLPEELAFQRALVNLRWHACTQDDIALFRSRLAKDQGELSLDHDGFKNVSIITAWNRDKDHLNAANSGRFADEVGEPLHDFYSVDTMLSPPAGRDASKQGRRYTGAKSLSKKMQTGLWQQPPCTSENVAGKLSLCIGMPILIRHNEATELCMTRGQEGRVVGWTSVPVPKHRDRRSLDVLYAELINPPHPVKLPHLPKNVVPLTKIPQALDARLINDEWVHISRSQVPVLPNFAMTDYSSQGKTRPWNVVDLTECRNFQAAYTCLSRGTRISQTLILRDFSDEKLCGELDGALRQEYRELDDLATITDLRYGGIFVLSGTQSTRWAVIDAYRAWKLTSAGEVEVDAPTIEGDSSEAVKGRSEVVYEFTTLRAEAKRKADELKGAPKKKRKIRGNAVLSSAWESPTGPIWDARDHSCAFDVWVYLLHTLWASDKARWSRGLGESSTVIAKTVDCFEGLLGEDPEYELTSARDMLRDTLRRERPGDYPEGTGGVDLVTLSRHLWEDPASKAVSTTCGSCGRSEVFRNREFQTIGKYSVTRDDIAIQDFVDEALNPFLVCENCGECTYRDHIVGEVVTFQVLQSAGVLLNSRVDIGGWGTYRLAGVIYFDSAMGHFVSRSVGIDNKVHSYDGMSGGYSQYDGVLGGSLDVVRMGTLGGAVASHAMYVLATRRSRM